MFVTKPTYRLLFFYAILVGWAISCSPEKNKTHAASSEQAPAIESDSINSWISQAKASNISLENRQKALQRAYEAAHTIISDSSKTKYFAQMSMTALDLKDSLFFKKVNQETQELAKKTKDSITLAEAHWDMATYYDNYSISDSTYFHYFEAQKIYEKLEDPYFSGRMLYNMAITLREIGDFTGSETTTIKAIVLLNPLNKYKELYNCYNNLGAITFSLREYDRALEYYQIAETYAKKLENKAAIALDLSNNIGVVYQDNGQHNLAIPYFRKVLEFDSITFVNPKLYAKALTNFAYSRFKTGEKRDVEIELKDAMYLQDSLGDIKGKSITQYFLAEYYLYQKDSTKALGVAKNAKLATEQSNSNERLLETLQLLTRIDPKNATAYTQEYIALNDELQEKERQDRNKFARIRFETDEFIEENTVLTLEKQVLTKEKQIWTGIALGALILSILGYTVFDQRRKNQKLLFQKAQQSANQEIFNLMLSQQQKVDEVKKMEQKRISEELHEGILGKMLGIRLLLSALNKNSDEEAVVQKANALKTLQSVESEIRVISHELSHAAYLEIPNFINSVQSLLDTTESASKIHIEFKHDSSIYWDSLIGEIKINLYRLIQEGVQNAVKHASCKNIVINFASENEQLHIAIVDDGKGFDLKKRKNGIGMRNISSRIKKLEGTWHVDSTSGAGTDLHFMIPIQYHNEIASTTINKEIGQIS